MRVHSWGSDFTPASGYEPRIKIILCFHIYFQRTFRKQNPQNMENSEVSSLDSIQADAFYETKLNSQLGKNIQLSSSLFV